MRVFSTYINKLCLLILLAMPGLAFADEDVEQDAVKDVVETDNRVGLSLDEIAVQLFNPVSLLPVIKNDFEYRLYQGSLADASDTSAWIYKFQPSFPIPLSNGKTIQLRLTIPIYGTQPLYRLLPDDADTEYSEFQIRQNATTIPKYGSFDHGWGHDHLADVSFDVAYGGVSDSGFISMFGIAGVLPTSADLSASVDQYQLGPEVALGKLTDWGIYGVWFKHLTGLYGEEAWDYNMTTLEVFFAYGLGNGWQVFSNPIIQYDWEGDTDNKLFLPIGGGISKTISVSRTPLKLAFEVQKYIVSPDALGPDWLFTFTMTPAFRNPLQK